MGYTCHMHNRARQVMRALVTIMVMMMCTARGHWWPSHPLDKLAENAMGFHNGKDCTYTRGDALECLKRYVDANGDQEISVEEIRRAKKLYAPPQLRAAEWVLNKMGYYISIKDVMKGCDANKDGHLTLSDWTLGRKTCMPQQSDLCKLKTVCDRAADITGAVKAPRIKIS